MASSDRTPGDPTLGHGAEFARSCRVFESQLGKGGFGEVWLGQNTKTAQWVAIKINKKPTDGPSDEVLREYETLVQLQHQNIVATYAFTYDRVLRRSSIYMELVSQGSVSDVIKQRYPPPHGMPLALVRKYAADVLEGLSFAHSKGLIHRDIKPANMLVSVSGSLKIADFGLCKSIHDQAPTGSGTAHGTAQYMSPAAARGMYNVASDIWAVGCSLVEMKSGRQPYHGRQEIEGGQAGCVQLLFSIATRGLKPSMPERTCETFRALINLCLSHPDDPAIQNVTCETLKKHPYILGQGIPDEDGGAMPVAKQDASRDVRGTPAKEKDKHVDLYEVMNPVSLMSEPMTLSTMFTTFDPPSAPLGEPPKGASAESTGVTAFLEWIASPENRDLKQIEGPDEVMLELLEQTAPQLDTLLDHRAYKTGSMLKAAMASVLRYVAVLFCLSPLTKRPFYEEASCQENVVKALGIVGAMHERITALLAQDPLPAYGTLADFEFILTVLKSGLELSALGGEGGTEYRAVTNQCEASEVLLRYPLVYDSDVEAVLNSYRFINDDRTVHALFTVCFKLLTPVPLEQIQQHRHLSEELYVFTQRPGYEWVVAAAAIEHILQLMLGATKVDGYRATLPEGKQESLAYIVSDLYFGAADVTTREGIGVRSFLTHRDVVEKGGWRVRHAAAQAAMTFYFSQTSTCADSTTSHSLSHSQAESLGRTQTGSTLPIPPVVVQDITSRLLPLVFTDADPRVVDSVNDIQQWLIYRVLFDWTLEDRIEYDTSNTNKILLIAKENCELTDFLDWKKNVFCTFQEDIGAEIFRGAEAITWVEFFNRLALFPPYNQRPSYITQHSYIFPLIRYLMQCEDVYQTGSLNPPQDQIEYSRDFLPFQVYFPIQSMIPDLVWLNENRCLHLGIGTRESEALLQGQPKGSFLIRPAKSLPGNLALTAVAASRTGTKITHKLIKQKEGVDHLVIDGSLLRNRRQTRRSAGSAASCNGSPALRRATSAQASGRI